MRVHLADGYDAYDAPISTCTIWSCLHDAGLRDFAGSQENRVSLTNKRDILVAEMFVFAVSWIIT